MKNNISHFKQWSNLFFIAPLAYAFQGGVFWYGLVISSVFIFSCMYHGTHEKRYAFIDTLLATLLMISNTLLLFLGNFKMPYFLITIITAIVALFFYKRQFSGNYNLNHGMWHLFSAVICFLSLMVYLL